jgi:hypothetical protein
MTRNVVSTRFRIKWLAAILVPILGSAVVTTWVATTAVHRQLEERTRLFGNAMADQLALTVTDQLVQKDLLSLNVVLNDLTAKGDFSFASVYSVDNRLLAQAGRNGGDLLIFTRDVVFQNASAGSVQIGLGKQYLTTPTTRILMIVILVHLMLVICLGTVGWLYGDFVYLWMTLPGSAGNDPPRAGTTPAPAGPDHAVEQVTILVIKIKPVRQLHAHERTIMKALALYHGSLEATEGDDLVITFTGDNQVSRAIRCGLLVNSIMHSMHANVTVKLGLHATTAAGGSTVIAGAKKQASYIASISDNKLLASRQAYRLGGDYEQAIMHAFHSSLAPDGDLYCVGSVEPADQELIERQARQLMRD